MEAHIPTKLTLEVQQLYKRKMMMPQPELHKMETSNRETRATKAGASQFVTTRVEDINTGNTMDLNTNPWNCNWNPNSCNHKIWRHQSWSQTSCIHKSKINTSWTIKTRATLGRVTQLTATTVICATPGNTKGRGTHAKLTYTENAKRIKSVTGKVSIGTKQNWKLQTWSHKHNIERNAG